MRRRLIVSFVLSILFLMISLPFLGLPALIFYMPILMLDTWIFGYEPGPEGIVFGIYAAFYTVIFFLLIEIYRARNSQVKSVAKDRAFSFVLSILLGNLILFVLMLFGKIINIFL